MYTHTQAAPAFGCEETQLLAFHIQDSPADWHQSYGTGTDSIVHVIVVLKATDIYLHSLTSRS